MDAIIPGPPSTPQAPSPRSSPWARRGRARTTSPTWMSSTWPRQGRRGRTAPEKEPACSSHGLGVLGPGTQAPLWTVDANSGPRGATASSCARLSPTDSTDCGRRPGSSRLCSRQRARGATRAGVRLREAAQPYVWSASAREGFRGGRAMRRRVEDNTPAPRPRELEA